MRAQRAYIGETANKFPDPPKLYLPPGSLQNIQKVIPKIQQTNSMMLKEEARLHKGTMSPIGVYDSEEDLNSLERLHEFDRLGTGEEGDR